MNKIKNFFGWLCGNSDKKEINDTQSKSFLEAELEEHGAINPALAAAIIGEALEGRTEEELGSSEISEAVEMLAFSEPYMFRKGAEESDVSSEQTDMAQDSSGLSTGGDHAGAAFSTDMMSDSEYYRHMGI